MSRTIYVNGAYLPYQEAAVHAEDRGFQFGDAVYEVCEVVGGRLVDETRHIARLDRSLNELKMHMPMSAAALGQVMREVIRRNRVRDGLVYLQVSRGARPRDFFFPPADTPMTVVCLARSSSRAKGNAQAERGIAIKTFPDIRWGRCDIKTVMLLPASLAKQAAREAGAQDAWFVDEQGMVTEGASSNAWIVTREGQLVTRQLDQSILPGVTRRGVIDALRHEGLELVERPFSLEEAKSAREAFLTSATSVVMPVVSIDDAPIGNGAPGSIATRLREMFHEVAEIAAP